MYREWRLAFVLCSQFRWHRLSFGSNEWRSRRTARCARQSATEHWSGNFALVAPRFHHQRGRIAYVRRETEQRVFGMHCQRVNIARNFRRFWSVNKIAISCCSQLPPELRQQGGNMVQVNMEDHRAEDFKPSVSKVKPFAGKGHTLGRFVFDCICSSLSSSGGINTRSILLFSVQHQLWKMMMVP